MTPNPGIEPRVTLVGSEIALTTTPFLQPMVENCFSSMVGKYESDLLEKEDSDHELSEIEEPVGGKGKERENPSGKEGLRGISSNC